MTDRPDYLSFTLPDSFIDEFKDVKPPLGYPDAAGTSLGEIVFARTYSRKKESGSKEQFYEVIRRVVEGTYSIQKDYCLANRLPWNGPKALASAKEMYKTFFNQKASPPGRGYYAMGSELVNKYKFSSSLNNCSFISTDEMTKHDPARPFVFLLEASTLGIGVGFDTKGAEKGFTILEPSGEVELYEIPDSREGWAESVRKLINSYLVEGKNPVDFDYSLIRPEGAPIKTFGGTASGPKPLIDLHTNLHDMFKSSVGSPLSSRHIADIGNMIGVCVVSGGVRRTAELLVGNIEDEEFLDFKNYERFPDRATHGWASNNSVDVKVGDDLTSIIEGITRNGEPGVLWMDTTRKYGRLKDEPDNKDWRAAGYNPCCEQPLESGEMCTLSCLYLHNAESLEDFLKAIKYAYLYAKTVTLLSTQWEPTNAIMQRNRRIGVSVSGIADFMDNHGLPKLREWLDAGYQELKRLDKTYSEWLCVRESIRLSTVKPDGSVGLVAGTSPGVHFTVGGAYYLRRVTFQKNDPIVEQFRKAGYPIEVSAYTPETSVVVEMPIKSSAKRSEQEVSIFEKISLAAEVQHFWSDNAVSVTVSFDPETEADKVGTVLHMYEGKLKTVSFLPMGGKYAQMPYEPITEDEYEERRVQILPVDLSPLYGLSAKDAEDSKFCTTDHCEVPVK